MRVVDQHVEVLQKVLAEDAADMEIDGREILKVVYDHFQNELRKGGYVSASPVANDPKAIISVFEFRRDARTCRAS